MNPLQIGDAAPDVAVSDHGGEVAPLSGRWRQRPLVLIFLRHFG